MFFYEERQYFRSNAMIWPAIIGMFIAFLTVVLNSSSTGSEWIGVLIFSVVFVVVAPLLLFASLHLRIEKEGLLIRYFPFHLKPFLINWTEVDRIELRKYSPLREYGGWGLKGTKLNRAYNVAGDMGLQIYLKDGKKILVGTSNPKKLEVALLEIRNQIKL